MRAISSSGQASQRLRAVLDRHRGPDRTAAVAARLASADGRSNVEWDPAKAAANVETHGVWPSKRPSPRSAPHARCRANISGAWADATDRGVKCMHPMVRRFRSAAAAPGAALRSLVSGQRYWLSVPGDVHAHDGGPVPGCTVELLVRRQLLDFCMRATRCRVVNLLGDSAMGFPTSVPTSGWDSRRQATLCGPYTSPGSGWAGST